MQNKNNYSLLTAINMIVGISVGSGIFFKIDDILAYTEGNVVLASLVFIIAALCIIFGSITLSQLAAISHKAGGVTGYFEEFMSPKWAAAFGWFQLLVYYPTIVAVVSWVGGSFTLSMLGLESSLGLEVLIGTGYLLFFYATNYLSNRVGGWIQNVATLIKIIPLVGVGILAFFWEAPPVPVLPDFVQNGSSLSWLAALAPMAFSYDGWVITTSISQEVDNPRRTMPIALTVGPIIVLLIYLFYFFGMVQVLGSQTIIALGDDAIYYIGDQLAAGWGGSLTTFFILVAILGVINGVTLGHIRIPQVLAAKGMIPRAETFDDMNARTHLSPRSTLTAAGISLVWMLVHYLATSWGVLGQSDVSEIAIAFSYLVYMVLYVKVFQLYRSGRLTNRWLAGLFPILASIGSLVIVLGAFLTNPRFVPFFLVFNAIVMWIGRSWYSRNQVE